MSNHIINISKLLKDNNYSEVDQIKELATSGSSRIYFRVFFIDEKQKSIIASFNPEINENIAHYSFTMHFRAKGFNVPEIYAKDQSYCYFLQQDLGNLSLLEKISNHSTEEVIAVYKIVIDNLLKFQTEGIKGLDLDVAFPVKEFNYESIMWDLNYFKYYFIKPHDISFDELQLENDFKQFANFLLEANSEFFVYRDFQARNIMICDDTPWFIDFQGGRKGPLQYDLVSLLYQAKANLNKETKTELLNYYLEAIGKIAAVSVKDFNKYYDAFVYFRTMQVMGAYGFRGILQKKGHFLQSIPYVIDNLIELLEHNHLHSELPELQKIFKQIVKLTDYRIDIKKTDKLLIDINSFSYKKAGIPVDLSGNGGGFIFDCRSLPNPGRYKELKDYTGMEKPVIQFLDGTEEIHVFLANCFELVKNSIDNYLFRGFSNLQINFGCTGGKHRSVYSAEWMSKKIQEYYKTQVEISLRHLQIEKGA
mgnify:CR=1 FL=1